MTTARCIEQGSCPLLRKGKTTQNENKNVAYFNTISIMKQRLLLGFLDMLSPNPTSVFGLFLIVQEVLVIFLSKIMIFLLQVTCKTPSFWVKLSSQSF